MALKLLCIDDDEGLLYLLRNELEKLSYEVIPCLDTEEALVLLQTEEFDVVLLDQEMPKLSGLEVIRWTHTLENPPPIIMVTGAGNEQVAVEAMRLGASDYVVKDANLVYLRILPSVIRQVIQERELIRQHQAAERALQLERDRSHLLSQFIRDASHEFRTPLTIIQLSSEMLGRIVSEPEQKTNVKLIQEESNRILNLVNHLIQITRLDNIASLPLESTELNSLLSNVLNRKRKLVTEKEIRLETALYSEPVNVLANAHELSNALFEIIDNAYHASQHDDVIRVSLYREDKKVVVSIRDEGIGMTDEQLSHIFERFYRVDSAHSTPGFGLGLPIVARIVELHDGTISVTSQPGAGTTVLVRLPITST
jgi:two-component system, sensor histidine kinase